MDITPQENRLLTLIKMYWRNPLTLHERFEKIISIILSLAIAVIIIVSLFQVIRSSAILLFRDPIHPMDHEVFQAVFGMIMTLLISMEFLHSVVRMATRGDSLAQVKTILLIGLLALTRKFIILDPADVVPAKIAALGGAALCLGAVYWLLRERDDRQAAQIATGKSKSETKENSG